MFTDRRRPELEIRPDEKLGVLKRLLPDLDQNPNVAVSGSLSQTLSRMDVRGRHQLSTQDLAPIHDIDLLSVEYERGRYDQLAKQASLSGFEVECKIPQTFSYLTPRGRELSERTATVDEGDGHEYRVRFTTPEYLLITRASASGGGKRDEGGKIRRRIIELQQIPSFSRDDFIELARLEIRTLRQVKQNTFKLWQRILSEDSPNPGETWAEFSRRKSQDFRSIVDEVRLANLVKTPQDVMAVDLEDVRPISHLERFLKEFTEGEDEIA